MPSLAELLDTSAQWGRGVQNKISDLVSPEAWAQALRNPPRVLSQYQQMQPGQQQQTISEAFDNALNFGPAMLGKIVYHGSPHRFPPTANNPLGEFDASKIGTGEGAQAYGAGAAYLAEAKGTATGYRDKLAAQQNPNVVDANLQKLYEKTGDWSKAVDEHMRRIYDTPKAKEKMRESLIKQGAPTNVEGGSLYKVDLPDEQIAKMLDWDKPLSQQSADVKKAISSDPRIARLIASGKIDDMYQNGGEFYRAVNSKYANDAPAHISLDAAENAAQANASRYLKSLGIPGIRYLDQGSRTAGEGTSNFVVFDPKHMNIIGRE